MIIIVTNKKRLYSILCITILTFSFLGGLKFINNKTVSVSSSTQKFYVAIIIDDFGNNSEGTDEMLALEIPFTGAVMPSMPKTSEEAELLYNSGKDVILHMPMQAHTGKLSWLGPTHILNDYSDEQVSKVLKDSITQINHCVGVNNHMGSKIMENKRILNIIFNTVKENDFIFIDSMTTPKSLGKELAENHSINYLERNIFLDSTQDLKKVEQNVIKTGEIAIKNGYAIAIGHVGAEGGKITAQAIKNTYKSLEDKGIEFVTVSQLAELIK